MKKRKVWSGWVVPGRFTNSQGVPEIRLCPMWTSNGTRGCGVSISFGGHGFYICSMRVSVPLPIALQRVAQQDRARIRQEYRRG